MEAPRRRTIMIIAVIVGLIKVPAAFNVLWRLAAGDFSYANWNITEVEYEIPEKF